MKDLPFYIFLSVLAIVGFGAILTENTDPTLSVVCSLKHEAYTFNFGELKRNKELDLVCLCKGT